MDYRNQYDFEGGPLDGAELILPVKAIFIGEIRIGIPVKISGDKDGKLSGLIVHKYVEVYSSGIEGDQATVTQLMYVGGNLEHVESLGLDAFDSTPPAS